MGKAWLPLLDQAWLQVEDKARLHLDGKSIARLKVKSQSLIRLLERDMKRANRALIKAIGKEQYAVLTTLWKAHLRWMRLHIVYYKPWGKPVHGLRKRQQSDIDELVKMSKRGLRDLRYQQPDDKELRRVMRLYAKYAHDGRPCAWTVHFLVDNKSSFQNAYHLAHFVIDHLNLKELTKS